ncbi:MAG: hypothetical protein ABR955_05535, partial [Verrucomicrobiota bacterium]
SAQSENRFPLKVAPNFQICPVRFAPAERDFFVVPSGRDWRSPKLKKGDFTMADTSPIAIFIHTHLLTNTVLHLFCILIRLQKVGELVFFCIKCI